MSLTPHNGYKLHCLICDREHSEQESTTYCSQCGGVLTVRYLNSRKEIQYPLKTLPENPLKSRETSLCHLPRLSSQYEADLYAKLEYEHTTGCFKDRGSFIEVRKAIELGADAICLASTGNMAASVAAYAAWYQIPCIVFVPESSTEAKLAQASIYNATIIRIRGSFSRCEEICREFALSGNYYLAGDYVFREEGQKSFSWELLEQGGGDADAILIPVGCGTNFAAITKGFRELKDAGAIDRIPRMIALQPESSSPVVEGIFKREKVITDQVQTIATSVATGDPIDFHKVLMGIDETGGEALTVSEEEILDSLREMALQEGHFTEPAAALPLAAIKKYQEKFKGQKCVLVLTGTGLKDTRVVVRHSLTPPVLDPSLESVNSYINSGFAEMQKSAWGRSRETVLANLKLDENHQQLYDRYVEEVNLRGKSLRKNEIEYLQSMVMQEPTGLAQPVRVTDYKVIMKKEGLVRADLKIELDGEERRSVHRGVGPIDAVLSALKEETARLLPVEIQNHEVEILSPAIDSLVVVTLTLERNGQVWVSKGASPDTIEAAIHAFEKGFAVAWNREHPSG
ncbi:MAG: threonine synthase [Balneolaceae bacterium]